MYQHISWLSSHLPLTLLLHCRTVFHKIYAHDEHLASVSRRACRKSGGAFYRMKGVSEKLLRKHRIRPFCRVVSVTFSVWQWSGGGAKLQTGASRVALSYTVHVKGQGRNFGPGRGIKAGWGCGRRSYSIHNELWLWGRRRMKGLVPSASLFAVGAQSSAPCRVE